MKPILETPRLVLRPVELADAPRIQTLFDDWEVVKWLAAVVPWPYPADGAVTFVQRVVKEMEETDRIVWAIHLKSEPNTGLVGIIELTPSSTEDNRGFWLGQAFHGRGYMSEAVRVVTDYAFEDLGMESLALNNAEPNLGSHRLKEKAGAEIVGFEEDVAFVSGQFRCIRWKLTKESWGKNRQNFFGPTEVL